MKYNYTLTQAQQALVEQNLSLVEETIRRCIKVNEGVLGLGYDDLHQEGSVALCRAAATYDGVSAQFGTYAKTLIQNYLLDCCKAANAQQKHICSLPVGSGFTDDEQPPSWREPSVGDGIDCLIDQMDVTALLEHYKGSYRGVARLGIEALELKVRGFTGADIARLYHTGQNHVGAWISRAKKMMKADAAFLCYCGRAAEETSTDL